MYRCLYKNGEMVLSGSPITPDGKEVIINGECQYPIEHIKNKRKQVKFLLFESTVKPRDCSLWFYNMNNLKEIQNLYLLDTSECTDMSSMFANCKSIEKLDLNMTYEELASAVSVTNVSDTQIIKISVQHENPKVAMKICNTIPSIFSEEVQRIVKASGVEVIDKAILPTNPIKPNKKMNVLIAMVLGVMVSVFIIFLIEALNTKIKEPKDIEEKLGIPVFGVVPKY